MLLPGSTAHYRTPEFDDLDDLELEHLVFQAKMRREDAIWILPLLAVIAAWIVVLTPVASALWLFLSAASGATGFDPWSFAGASAIAFVSALAFSLSIVVWIAVRRLLILRSMRRIRGKASCPYCAFDLRGLPVADYRLVRCPECGELLNLIDLGLTKRDLALGDGFTSPPAPASGYLEADLAPERLIPTERDPAAPAKPRKSARPAQATPTPRSTDPGARRSSSSSAAPRRRQQ